MYYVVITCIYEKEKKNERHVDPYLILYLEMKEICTAISDSFISRLIAPPTVENDFSDCDTDG